MVQSLDSRPQVSKGAATPASLISGKPGDMFASDAQVWGLTPRSAVILALAPILVSVCVAATYRSQDLFRWLIDEDLVIENLQFALILMASLISARSSVRLWRSGRRTLGMLCGLYALAAFFVAGEEISWGQRILGIPTPPKLERINWQQEISAHNIYGFNGPFTYALMLVGLYGTVMPFLRHAAGDPRQRSMLSYLLIPPLCLVPGFFMPFGYRLIRFVFRPEVHYPHRAFFITEFSEVTELCLYFAVLVFAWLNWRRIREVPAS